MKIGKYNDDEILEYMTDREGSFLGRSMFDDIRETILNKDKEIERLNKSLEEQRHFYLKELDKKDNIINELEKWLDEESEKTILSVGHLTCLMMCKNKLQELKGEYKEGSD